MNNAEIKAAIKNAFFEGWRSYDYPSQAFHGPEHEWENSEAKILHDAIDETAQDNSFDAVVERMQEYSNLFERPYIPLRFAEGPEYQPDKSDEVAQYGQSVNDIAAILTASHNHGLSVGIVPLDKLKKWSEIFDDSKSHYEVIDETAQDNTFETGMNRIKEYYDSYPVHPFPYAALGYAGFAPEMQEKYDKEMNDTQVIGQAMNDISYIKSVAEKFNTDLAVVPMVLLDHMQHALRVGMDNSYVHKDGPGFKTRLEIDSEGIS